MKLWRSLFDPQESIGLYILGTAALTVGIQIIYDVFKEPFGLLGAIGLAGFLFLIVAGVIWWQYMRQIRGAQKYLHEISDVPAHKGLILLVSPGNKEIPRIAFAHHQSALEHCWLISSERSLSTSDELEKLWHEEHPNIQIHSGQELLVQEEDFLDTWRLVDSIYTQGITEYGLQETDILADITGGRRPMSTGMALACFGTSRNMQYIKTPRDLEGKPIKDAPRLPVLISTQRYPSRSETT